jgi:hypothetical protein
VFVVLFGYLSRGRDRQHHKTPERKVTFTSIHITERRGQRVYPTTVGQYPTLIFHLFLCRAHELLSLAKRRHKNDHRRFPATLYLN